MTKTYVHHIDGNPRNSAVANLEIRPAAEHVPAADVEEWYEVETSRVGADDWFAVSNTTADTLAGARNQRCSYASGFEYRIVRKRLTSEVVA